MLFDELRFINILQIENFAKISPIQRKLIFSGKTEGDRKKMKKGISYFLALTMLFVMSVTDLSAQTRIQFARGATSKTVTGTIGVNRGVAGANYRTFVLNVRNGQTISATVSARNGNVVFTDNDSTSLRYRASYSGDHEISIYNGGSNSTSFSLTVSVR